MHIYQGLSHKLRIKIIELLAEYGHLNLTIDKIAERLALSRQLTKHHLDALKESGIVSVEKHRNYSLHYLNEATLSELQMWLARVKQANSRSKLPDFDPHKPHKKVYWPKI
jgi:DNA-binding transcriptional ArsR family regulator